MTEQPDAGPLVIAGSVGPYGAYLTDCSEYRGDYHLSEEEMMAFHRPRFDALVQAGADVFACETLFFKKIKALETFLGEYSDTVAWFSFTLRDSKHLSDSTPLFHRSFLLSQSTHRLLL